MARGTLGGVTMGRRIVMDDHVVEATPVYVRQEARLRLEEIAEGMEGIPPDSAFWASIG